MVVRRFLVPFVLVRIQVGQLKKRLETMFRAFFGYIGILLMVDQFQNLWDQFQNLWTKQII